jgi:Fe2+ transport system protein FeoA
VRRRLLELGLTPGTVISVVGVSPLGDPLELSLRGGRLSVRKKEALGIEVEGRGSAAERSEEARGRSEER